MLGIAFGLRASLLHLRSVDLRLPWELKVGYAVLGAWTGPSVTGHHEPDAGAWLACHLERVRHSASTTNTQAQKETKQQESDTNQLSNHQNKVHVCHSHAMVCQ